MALILKYISIQLILDNLLDISLLTNLTLEKVVRYTVRFIRKVGAPLLFLENTAVISIREYRGVLPCDFINMKLVRNDKGYCFRYSTDSFHMSTKEVKKDSRYHVYDNPDLTYKIQGNCIFTSIKEGEVEIAYEAIAVDKDGFPFLPDNESFIDALELYIKKKEFENLFYEGRINVLALLDVKQEYAFAVGQAQRDLAMPTIDQMESLSNMFTSLIPRVTEHSKGFKTLGNKEFIKLL